MPHLNLPKNVPVETTLQRVLRDIPLNPLAGSAALLFALLSLCGTVHRRIEATNLASA